MCPSRDLTHGSPTFRSYYLSYLSPFPAMSHHKRAAMPQTSLPSSPSLLCFECSALALYTCPCTCAGKSALAQRACADYHCCKVWTGFPHKMRALYRSLEWLDPFSNKNCHLQRSTHLGSVIYVLQNEYLLVIRTILIL